jgi:hypothetical protein
VIVVSKLQVKEDGPLVIETVSGARFEYRREQLLRLDFSTGRLEFLPDMEPNVLVEPPADRLDRYRWHSEADKRNRNLDGNGIQLGGAKFAKGLSLPAPTTLRYTLGGKYKQFKTVVGVDDTVGGSQGGVILTIEGDGRPLFTGEFRRNDPPRLVPLNVKDVDRLTIAVRPTGVLAYGLRVDLGNARVNK